MLKLIGNTKNGIENYESIRDFIWDAIENKNPPSVIRIYEKLPNGRLISVEDFKVSYPLKDKRYKNLWNYTDPIINFDVDFINDQLLIKKTLNNKTYKHVPIEKPIRKNYEEGKAGRKLYLKAVKHYKRQTFRNNKQPNKQVLIEGNVTHGETSYNITHDNEGRRKIKFILHVYTDGFIYYYPDMTRRHADKE